MKIKLLSVSKNTAIAGVDFEYDFADVYKCAAKLAETLPLGTSKAVIFSENRPEWAFALYAVWIAGAAVVPVDAQSNAEELAFVLSDAAPEVVFTSRANAETARTAAEKISSGAKIINIDEFFANAEYKNPPLSATVEREDSDLGLIVYTSGTTGNPKGVMLTFANMYANMKAVAEAKYYFEKIRVLAMLPLHHILPLMGTLIMPLSVNGKVVMPRSISPEEISAALQKHSVDMVISVPRFYELLHSNIMAKINQSKIARTMFFAAKTVGCLKFSQMLFGVIHKKFGGAIKFWVSGGASLDKKVWSDLCTLGFSVREGYGMTECAPIIAFPRINNIKMGSVGQPLSGIEARIVDGEIVVRGANVTSGYYRRPEETAETIRNGWLYTGDLGYFDDDGFLFITGRRKEIIVLANGKNVNPAELETNLQRQCPDIVEAGVLMYQNTFWAIIRVKQELVDKLGAEGVEEHIRNNGVLPYNRNAPTYKRIIKIALTTDELPRTRVGKLKRHLLAAYIENKKTLSARDKLPEPASRIYKQLKDVLANQTSVAVDCDAHMEMDLGLDSLGKISVQCFVQENYGVKIAEKDFQDYPTLRQFAEMVEKNMDSDFDGQLKTVSWADIVKSCDGAKINKPNAFHFATIWAFKTFVKLLYKVEYTGLENLPRDGAAILAANHQSYIDGIFLVGGCSKAEIYKTYFFAKIRNIIKSGAIRKFADFSNVIVMDINDNVKDSIVKLAKVLKDGGRIAIFPEGTRTKDGDVAEFKPTFAILAKEMNAPVIPVRISGAFENIQTGKTLPKFGSHIRVDYLPPMTPKDTQTYEDFAADVRAAIASPTTPTK